MKKEDRKLPVIDLPIRLGQFLKLADLVQDGLEARIIIQEGRVSVNGMVETRRGRKLHSRDTVTVDGETWVVGEAEGR